jgi:hypothetical protein
MFVDGTLNVENCGGDRYQAKSIGRKNRCQVKS